MLLFIHGPDTYRAREKVRAIKARYHARYPGAFELHEFDVSEALDFTAVRQPLETRGFFAPQRLVIIKNALQGPAPFVTALSELLKGRDLKKQKDITVLFWEGGDLKKAGALKAESAPAAFTWLKRNALAEEYALLTGEAFVRWVRRELHKRAVTLSPGDLARFSKGFEGDSWRAALEIEKISLGHPLALAQQGEAEIFDLVRALWRKDQKGSLRTLRSLLAQGANEFYLLSMLAYAVRKSLERALPESGYRVGTVREREAEGLRALHQQVVETDLKIKTGALEARFGLELLTLRLTHQ